MNKLVLKFPLGLSAPQFQAQGGTWSPDLHFNGTVKDWKDFEKIVEKYASFVVAYYLYESFPGYWSLECQFGADEQSREAFAACRKECRAVDGL